MRMKVGSGTQMERFSLQFHGYMNIKSRNNQLNGTLYSILNWAISFRHNNEIQRNESRYSEK